MDKILEQGKNYELLVTKYDPAYNDLVVVIEVVKQFIIENGLIVYGGSALDYALRLKGDKIYPDDMLAVPDLDMYSPDNVEHAYTLADILYRMGYNEARAINAQHMETMRVDVKDNHFIADITYRPPEIFATLPVLNYNGMKIIHPIFQRIDLHSSLCFPYDNAPREVVFDRWSKDVKRFNIINKYYPIKCAEYLPLRNSQCSKTLLHWVANGFLAYSIIYTEYAKSMHLMGGEIPKTILAATFNIVDNTVNFSTLDDQTELINFDIQNMNIAEGKRCYETYIHILPERIEFEHNKSTVVVYSIQNRLLSVNSFKVGDYRYRVANVQYIMKHMLAMYNLHSKKKKLAGTYLKCYESLLNMVESYEQTIVKFTQTPGDSIKNSPLFLSVNTFGSNNINLSRGVALSRLYHDLDNTELAVTPINYYPAKSISKGHPVFNYASSTYFRESGLEISKS